MALYKDCRDLVYAYLDELEAREDFERFLDVLTSELSSYGAGYVWLYHRKAKMLYSHGVRLSPLDLPKWICFDQIQESYLIGP